MVAHTGMLHTSIWHVLVSNKVDSDGDTDRLIDAPGAWTPGALRADQGYSDAGPLKFVWCQLENFSRHMVMVKSIQFLSVTCSYQRAQGVVKRQHITLWVCIVFLKNLSAFLVTMLVSTARNFGDYVTKWCRRQIRHVGCQGIQRAF